VETWRYGAFEEQFRAADGPKVFVNVEHEQGIRGVVRHGIQLREERSGLKPCHFGVCGVLLGVS
jgi:hypothetical protein